MAKILNYSEVKRQSEAVYSQFGESKWIPAAKENATLARMDANDLKNIGLGKTLVCAAMGESTEEQFELLKKYRERFDLVVNDKMFGEFVKRGVRPDYVLVADTNIPFRWIEPYIEQTAGVKLVSTLYANPEWTKAWKGPRYFYACEDSINSERVFLPIFNNQVRLVPASSNVSNAMCVFFLGANNTANINWAGYDQYLLVGYDYSWRPRAASAGIKTGKYYAWNDPEPKRFYMNHRTLLDMWGNWVHTSENLLFSAKWLVSYLHAFKPPVVNCSGRGLLDVPFRGDLEKHLLAIKPDQKLVSTVVRRFNALGMAHRLLEETKQHFEESREALYGSR